MQIDQLSLISISKEPCTDPYKSKKLYTYLTLFNVYNSTNICTYTYTTHKPQPQYIVYTHT